MATVQIHEIRKDLSADTVRCSCGWMIPGIEAAARLTDRVRDASVWKAQMRRMHDEDLAPKGLTAAEREKARRELGYPMHSAPQNDSLTLTRSGYQIAICAGDTAKVIGENVLAHISQAMVEQPERRCTCPDVRDSMGNFAGRGVSLGCPMHGLSRPMSFRGSLAGDGHHRAKAIAELAEATNVERAAMDGCKRPWLHALMKVDEQGRVVDSPEVAELRMELAVFREPSRWGDGGSLATTEQLSAVLKALDAEVRAHAKTKQTLTEERSQRATADGHWSRTAKECTRLADKLAAANAELQRLQMARADELGHVDGLAKDLLATRERAEVAERKLAKLSPKSPTRAKPPAMAPWSPCMPGRR